jgi:alkyl sulfatase BDS1-like metallo-beta-lactamase superfamily hydrolase
MVANLGVEQFFDSMAIRVNGPRAWDLDFSLDWDITDVGPYRMTLRNGVLVHAPGGSDGTAQATIRLTRADLPALVLGGRPVDQLPGVTVTGDHDVLARLTAVLDPPDPDFAIVTP